MDLIFIVWFRTGVSNLPWAILEDEHLVWATHTFGLGRMGGSRSHPPQPRSKRAYRQLRSQTAEAASFDSGSFMGLGGGPPIDGDGTMQPPCPLPLLPSFPLSPSTVVTCPGHIPAASAGSVTWNFGISLKIKNCTGPHYELTWAICSPRAAGWTSLV